MYHSALILGGHVAVVAVVAAGVAAAAVEASFVAALIVAVVGADVTDADCSRLVIDQLRKYAINYNGRERCGHSRENK